MSRFALTAALVLTAPLLLAATYQKRAKENKPADFPTLMKQAGDQWTAKKFGACINSLREATALATQERMTVIKGALPQAPEGWEQVPEKKKDMQATAPFAGLTAAAGTIIERRWNQTEGRGNVSVTVHADAPMVGMLAPMMSNPALLGDGKELIEYNTHKAILETRNDGKRRTLQIIIDEKHLVDVTANGLTEEQLFAMWSQEIVDRLSSAMSY